MSRIVFLLVSMASWMFHQAYATTPPLERIVSVSFEGESIESILTILSKEGRFTFSYSPTIIPVGKTITGTFKNKSVREILNEIFENQINYKERGNYIILTKAPPAEQRSATKPLMLMGYITDSQSGKKVQSVSVYEKNTISGAVSDQFGFFKLRIEKPSQFHTISVSKKGYQDTTFTANLYGEDFFQINISPIPKIIKEDSIAEVVVVKAPTLEELRAHDDPDLQRAPDDPFSTTLARINMMNITDTLHRKFQVSVLPFIGSNHRLSGNVTNDYSLNILGGYSMGTRKLEIGGVFNIDRGDVEGFQAAGTFNFVRGKVEGTQVAGSMNYAEKGFQGAQFAGTINVSGNDSRGVQLAGLANIQLKETHGFQGAGAINVSTGKLEGTQLAVINVGNKVYGTQIGVLNYADSINGVPIGLLSIVNKGYHTLEFSADEIFYTNLAFRTGVPLFYNIVSAAVKPQTLGDPVWSLGYGIGTMPRISNWLRLNFDITSHHVSYGHLYTELSSLNKLYVGVDIKWLKKLHITAGATLNAYLSNMDSDHPSLFADGYQPSFIADREVSDNVNMKMWWGMKVGLRFF